MVLRPWSEGTQGFGCEVRAWDALEEFQDEGLAGATKRPKPETL